MNEHSAESDAPRCVAHGNPRCADCSRITLANMSDDGECRGCSVWGADGIHWDTCPARIRGPVYTNRTEALAALAVDGLRQEVRRALIDYARPGSGPTWESLSLAVERVLETCVIPPDAAPDGAA